MTAESQIEVLELEAVSSPRNSHDVVRELATRSVISALCAGKLACIAKVWSIM